VLWAKGGSFQSATAPTLRGPYTNVGRYKPEPGCTAGDSSSFLDPVGGKAYMVYSQHECKGENVRAMKLLLLNDDWTAPAAGAAGKPVPTVVGHIEAPCPFYSELTKKVMPVCAVALCADAAAAVLTVYCATKHYIWSSHTSGWKPNPAELLVSSGGMGGPWTSLGNPSNNHSTFGTQGSHIEKLPGPNPPGVERFLYVGDRYIPYISTKEGSRYIFLALEVHADGKVVLFPDQPWGLNDWPGSPPGPPPGPSARGCEAKLDQLCPRSKERTPKECGKCAKENLLKLLEAGCTAVRTESLCKARAELTVADRRVLSEL